MASRSLRILGCGTSVGVPMLGCDCQVCSGGHPRNQRTRSSVLFHLPQGNLLIDTTPEMRLQLLRERIALVHAVAYTHYHVDHLFGMDDLRAFPRRLGGPLPIYCTEEVESVIRESFAYAFQPETISFLPKIDFYRIRDEPFIVLDEKVTPIPLHHAHFQVLGFRIGRVAYCTDVNNIPESSWPLLVGLDVLVLDALRRGRPHPSHFSVEQALDVAAKVRAKRLILTHMAHDIDYETIRAELPEWAEPAYDGMVIDF